MERDFMGLNSKESVVVVKEEAVEGCKDSAFSQGSGVHWPLSNKVSSLPHFMSFKVAQEEKTADAFDASNKRPLGEIQKVHDGQGGTHFPMTTYPVQHNALPMHFSHDVKMLQAANQPISVSMRNSFFKTHFAGAGQNFAGATTKQQLYGGIHGTAANSIHPSLGSIAGTTEPWFNSKSSGAPAQLTIFYGGRVNVFNDISPEKAQAIMLLAGTVVQPRAQVQVPASKQAGESGVPVNQPANTLPSSGISSPMSVSSHPVGQSGGGSSTDDEVMALKPAAGVSIIPVSKVEPQKIVTSLGPLAATTMISSSVPQFRQASLARFFEKRKERVMNSAPYNIVKKSSECAIPGSDNAAHAVSSGAGAAGSLSTNKESGHVV